MQETCHAEQCSESEAREALDGEVRVVCRPVRAISPGSLRSGGSSALPCEITPARPRTCIRVVSGYLWEKEEL